MIHDPVIDDVVYVATLIGIAHWAEPYRVVNKQISTTLSLNTSNVRRLQRQRLNLADGYQKVLAFRKSTVYTIIDLQHETTNGIISWLLDRARELRRGPIWIRRC